MALTRANATEGGSLKAGVAREGRAHRPDPPKSTDADLCVDLISIDPM